MSSLHELRDIRIGKMQKLIEAGMDPYPASVARTISIPELRDSFEEKEKEGGEYSIAGRIMAIRGQGAIFFVVLKESNAEFQAVFKKEEIPEKLLNLFHEGVDLGDFILVTGTLFRTKAGEPSVLVKNWQMATKALLPLPEKWAGLKDVEERYRKRYLELVSDPSAYERFETRSQIIRVIRKYFDDLGFLEIETPVLQNQAGGAMARTFSTHHNDLDMDMHLRIALEIDHKIVMAAGYPGVYEIGKTFRNEGSDPGHIQEFTMMEWYSAYHTLEDNIRWTEELLQMIAREILGKTEFAVWDNEGAEHAIDFDRAFARVSFNELLQKYAGITVEADIETIQEKAKEYGMEKEEIEKTGRGNLLDFVYKKSARKHIIQPTFIIDYPGEVKPLAQQSEDGTARVAQLIVAGMEITNQYAELVNPIVQRELLEAQARAREAGDEEAMEVDERFLTAMEHGMPPMTGFGMGIDRIVAIFTEQKNLRDVIFFPIMRDREK